MLNNIMIGKYYPIKSKIHAMNPLAKIVCTMLFVVMAVFANTLEVNFAMALLVMLMILNTHIPFLVFYRTLKTLRFILLFILLINIIFWTGWQVTVISLLRVILIVLYTTILTLTTPPTEITYGLEKFFAPLKIFHIPVANMAFSLSLALRFIPTIIDEGAKILKAQASRGIDYYHSNIKGKWIAIKSLLIPMFRLTLKRADALSDAMEVRLYNVKNKRTNFRQNKWGFFDTYLVIIHILIMAVFIVRGVVM